VNKTGKISNMLSDYERTKNFNQELMKNIGSPKGPIFARTGGIINSGGVLGGDNL
jgi:hypothetical protein